MFSLAQLRRLGPSLLGLLLLAQVAGIVPLITTGIQHAFENDRDVAADVAATGGIAHVHHHHARHEGEEPHRHDSSDPNDQCCTLLHHLAGVLPLATEPSRSGLTIPVTAALPGVLLGTEPGSPERPPKL